jgi:hypothetical protein
LTPGVRPVGVELVENVVDVERFGLAHQEVEVGEGELHVVAPPKSVPRRFPPLVVELASHRLKNVFVDLATTA